jgi:hypothetical protein
MQAANPIQRPMTEADLATLEAARRWYHRYFYGFWSPALEADLLVRAESPDMIVQPLLDSLAARPDYQKPYARVQAPALALYAFATVQTRWPWLDGVTDSATVARAQRYLDELVIPWQSASIDRFRRELPRAIVQRIDGSHYFFVSHETEVLASIQSFLANSPR